MKHNGKMGTWILELTGVVLALYVRVVFLSFLLLYKIVHVPGILAQIYVVAHFLQSASS